MGNRGAIAGGQLRGGGDFAGGSRGIRGAHATWGSKEGSVLFVGLYRIQPDLGPLGPARGVGHLVSMEQQAWALALPNIVTD